MSLHSRRIAGYLVPGVSVGLLAVLSIMALCPVGSLSAYAEEDPGAMTLSAFLSPSITLSMAASVSKSIEPTADGTFQNLSTVAHVQVMNSEYYDISIHGDKDMVGKTNTDAKIVAVSGSKKASEFAANTWGYSVSKNTSGSTAVATTADTTYNAVPTSSTAIAERQQTTDNAADDYYTLNFGAKVDTSIPADTYSSQVTLSVVAAPTVVASIFDGIETMQELTPAICKAANTGDSAQLKDARTDNADTSSTNTYWVTKLPDGNCWMTQNLDYAASTPASTSSIGTDTSDTGKIWDDGLKVMTNPTTFSTSDATTSVAGKTASTNKDMTASISGNEYNAHYLTGNYYQYSAAQTACPSIGSQWKMPTSNQAATVNGSFNKLTNGVAQNQFVVSPYYFSAAGYVWYNSGKMGDVGSNGHYWSSTPNGDSKGYYLLFGGSIFNPSGDSSRYLGFSVRCYVNGTDEYNLIYNANGGSDTTPAVQSATDTADTHEFTVADQGELTREGYTFLGWSEDAGATTAQYPAGSKITLTKAKASVTLYAVWKVAGPFGGVTTMQALTPALCKAAEDGDTAQLKDTRTDNADTSSTNTYWVTKLKDGNCWMTQNLDYATSEQKLSTGTAQSSDNGKVWDVGLKVVTGFGQSAVSAVGGYDAHYLIGNYYQQSVAATACSTISSNWNLPTASQATTANGSYSKLLDGVSATQIVADPYYFTPAGYINRTGGSLSNTVGGDGGYRSSTAGYNLYFLSSTIKPFNSYTSYTGDANGFSVRCYVNGN